MNKSKFIRSFFVLLTTFICMGGFSVTAFAQTPEGQDDTDDSGVVYEEPQKEEPLTPDGNATLVDDFGGNKQLILELDCLTLNEDRHTNNLAVLRNEETKEFRLCPIFDNGLSLLSDLNDYPLTDDLYTCIERVQAKPFDSDHVEQVTAAEQLYGRQLTFRISHGELRSELNLLSEAYSPDILQRAERVLLEQKRKHSWLF